MTQLNIEQTILTNLIFNSEYARKVIPYIKGEYFQDTTQRIVFETIDGYVAKYKANPDNIEVKPPTINETDVKSPLIQQGPSVLINFPLFCTNQSIVEGCAMLWSLKI